MPGRPVDSLTREERATAIPFYASGAIDQRRVLRRHRDIYRDILNCDLFDNRGNRRNNGEFRGFLERETGLEPATFCLEANFITMLSVLSYRPLMADTCNKPQKIRAK
jgi:hypothetical protein